MNKVHLYYNQRKAPLGIQRKITKIAFQPFVIDHRPEGLVVPIIFSPINFNNNGRFAFSDQEEDNGEQEEPYDENEDNNEDGDNERLDRVDGELASESPIKLY